MSYTIHWNGSTWAGEKPRPLSELFARLASATLSPSCAPFMHCDRAGQMRFFGNFEEVSHAFCVEADDEESIRSLYEAVWANASTPEYARAEADYKRRLAERAIHSRALALRD